MKLYYERRTADLEELLVDDVSLLERMQLADGVRMIITVLRIYLESFLLQYYTVIYNIVK